MKTDRRRWCIIRAHPRHSRLHNGFRRVEETQREPTHEYLVRYSTHLRVQRRGSGSNVKEVSITEACGPEATRTRSSSVISVLTSSNPICRPVVSSMNQGIPSFLIGRVGWVESRMNCVSVRLSGMVPVHRSPSATYSLILTQRGWKRVKAGWEYVREKE